MTKKNKKAIEHIVGLYVKKDFENAHKKFISFADKVQMKLSGMDMQKWLEYTNNVEKNFELVERKINESFSRFKKEAKRGNVELAAKNFGRTLHACLKGLKVAMVDMAESMGITRILRKLKIVKNTPDEIMGNLEREIEKINPTLEEKVKSEIKTANKKAKKAVSKFKGNIKNLDR